MRKIFLIIIFFTFLEAKEIFIPQNIYEYLNKENPFVSTLFNKENIAKERIEYYKGAFNTKISSKYDFKEYPATSGEYYDIFTKKKIQNGIEFLAGYRNAEGTQEYNNIKTGKEGEILLGVTLPIIDLLKGANSDKTKLDIAKIESVKQENGSKNNLRIFYLEVFNIYYKLLHNKIILNLEQQLLKKAKDRQEFIQQKVKAGVLPELSLVEAEQQIINRAQRSFLAIIIFENSFTDFAKYLNFSKAQFKKRYILNDFLEIPVEEFNFDEVFQIAKTNRPDIKMLEFDKQKLNIEKENIDLLKYPNTNLTLYGVHDFKYGNGFKISFNIEFPIERSEYESKIGEYQQNIKNTNLLQQKKLIEIRRYLKNIISSLNILKENIENAKQEIKLVKKLESGEYKKYLVGSSNLFLLNQREIYTLDVEKKVLQYKLNYILLKEELSFQIGFNNKK